MGRGIYREAIREMRRLETVPDDQLRAECAAILRDDVPDQMKTAGALLRVVGRL